MTLTPVRSDWIRLGEADGRPYDGYLALPPAGRGPGLLLLQEIFGVNEHIRAVAEQYALAGFVVLAPDLFWRQAPRVELDYVGEQRERALGMMKAAPLEELTADALTALQALKARPEVGPAARCGVLGYCLGGRLAWRVAAAGGVDAAVAYYGGGIQDQLSLAASIHCPTMLHYGTIDPAIPLEAVERVRTALAPQLGSGQAVVQIYDQAGHGFNCWARASYNPRASALALGRTLRHLALHLF